MSYTVAIRNNSTGEIRLMLEDLEWDESSRFWWTDGSFGCDCNRHLEFMRAGGPWPEDDPHWNDAEHECGDEAYSVLYVDLPSGERIQIDSTAVPQSERR